MMLVMRLLIALVVALSIVSTGACRDPTELTESINAIVIVVGVDDDDVVTLQLGEAERRAEPKSSDNVVSFNLVLSPGIYEGEIIVFEVEDDDERENEDALAPKFCGVVDLTVPEVAGESPVLVAVIAEQLGSCGEEDDEQDGGEGEDDPDEDQPGEDDPVDEPAEGEGENEDPGV